MTSPALALALSLAGTALAAQSNQLAFPFTRTVAFGRLDPIISPGQVSEHVHKFLGASNVLNTANFSSLSQSQCTTHPITKDLSSYWMPALYHIGENGYTLLDSGNNIVYYGTAGNVQAFPDNFQMVTGSPTQTCEEGPQRYFVCIDADGNGVHTTTLPQTECAQLGMHITFPSCWDGKDFDYMTQAEHLVMPIGGALAAECPSTHNIKLPSLMMDQFANATGLPKNPNGPTYALAFNDTVGCGMHADFIQAWDRDLLQSALDECKDFNGDDNVADCKPLAPYYNREKEAECKFQAPLPAENIGLTGEAIPNLVWCDSPGSCEVSHAGVKWTTDLQTVDLFGVPVPVPKVTKEMEQDQAEARQKVISSAVAAWVSEAAAAATRPLGLNVANATATRHHAHPNATATATGHHAHHNATGTRHHHVSATVTATASSKSSPSVSASHDCSSAPSASPTGTSTGKKTSPKSKSSSKSKSKSKSSLGKGKKPSSSSKGTPRHPHGDPHAAHGHSFVPHSPAGKKAPSFRQRPHAGAGKLRLRDEN